MGQTTRRDQQLDRLDRNQLAVREAYERKNGPCHVLMWHRDDDDHYRGLVAGRFDGRVMEPAVQGCSLEWSSLRGSA
ncbi:hypothetical protein NHQ30_009092, partial [Ciborinia camelliae]